MKNGDIILTGRKHQGVASDAIRLGQKMRYGFDSPYSVWPHCAMIFDAANNVAIEAGRKGIQLGDITERFGEDWRLVETNVVEHDWRQMKEFLTSCLAAKWKYGVVTFVGLGVYCLTTVVPLLPTICFQRTGTAVCSGLVCDALTRAGYVWDLPPYWMMPADIAKHFDVRG